MSNRIDTLIWRGDNRSAVKALQAIADQSDKTKDRLSDNADKSSTALDRTRESATRLKDAMVGLAGMVGIGGVAFGMKDLIEGGMQLQAAQSQLQTALRATGQMAAGTQARLQAMAESMSTKGGFSTIENLGALTQFVRETKSASEAQNLLSLSTNIARARNLGLADTQSIVAKAYDGQARGLQALLGPMVSSTAATVGLTTAHAQQIATLENEAAMMGKMGSVWLRQQEVNDHITAQEAELAQLQNKRATATQILAAATTAFAGSTSAYNRTAKGQLSDLDNSLHNLAENLGKTLLPAAVKIIGVFASVAKWMSHNKTIVLVLVGGLTLLGAAWAIVAVATAAWSAVGTVATAVATGLGVALNLLPFLAIATLIALVVTHFKTFESVAVGAWHAVESAAVSVWHAIESGATDVWHFLEKIASTVFNAVTWPYRKAFDFIKAGWHDVTHVFSDIGHFAGSALHDATFGLLSTGGVVKPKYLAVGGGPFGTDTVPTMLTPGEGVVSTSGMNNLGGAYGLSAINSGIGAPGMGGGRFTVQNSQPIVVKVDGREILATVVQQALNVAARGPTSLVGGSLVTGGIGMST